MEQSILGVHRVKTERRQAALCFLGLSVLKCHAKYVYSFDPRNRAVRSRMDERGRKVTRK